MGEHSTGAGIENLRARLMFTTPDGDIMHIDRTLFITMYFAPDGTWEVDEHGGSVDAMGVIRTQEDLDGMPAI